MGNSKRRPRKNLSISLTQSEREQIALDKSKTTCRSLSEYAKKRILGQPVTIYYRDQAYDHFTEAYIGFKRDLDAILETGAFDETYRNWLCKQMELIKSTVNQLYDHVRENRTKYHHPPDL